MFNQFEGNIIFSEIIALKLRLNLIFNNNKKTPAINDRGFLF